MATVSKSYIFDTMVSNHLPFYVVKDGSNVIDEQQNEEVNAEQAVDMLKNVLDQVKGNFVTIYLSNVSKENKSTGRKAKQIDRSFMVDITSAKGVSGVPSMDLGIVQQLFEQNKQLEIKLKEVEHQRELDLIKKEIEELKSGNGITGFIENFAKTDKGQMIIGALLSKVLPGSNITALAGIDDAEMQSIINRIKNVDADCNTLFSHIAIIAEKNPSGYFEAKKWLANSI